MIAIVDYGVGNLFSLKSSLDAIGAESVVTSDAAMLTRADGVILPGVGAFEDAIARLRTSGLAETLIALAEMGKPMMGICLGMQLLFEKSYEYGEHMGLGLIPGEVRPIRAAAGVDVKIPHMGWNALHFTQPHALFADVKEGEHVYFVHSYFATQCTQDTIATAEYGVPLTAAVARANVMGCQFHPEKSGETGLRILRAFCNMKEIQV